MKATQKVTHSFVRALVKECKFAPLLKTFSFPPAHHQLHTDSLQNAEKALLLLFFLYKSPSSLLFTAFVRGFHPSRRAIMR
jgi:hypothetical protein